MKEWRELVVRNSNKNSVKLGLLLLLGLAVVSLTGCFTDTGANKVQIFTEMHYSQSYRSQETPRLLPPDGSVPVTGQKMVEYSAEEARELTNPLPANDQVLSEGAELYRVNCAMCHGVEGRGDGPVAEFLLKWNYARPADLTADATHGRSDGEVFSIIGFTLFGQPGLSPMPEYSKMLTEDEIWSLVQYIRTLR